MLELFCEPFVSGIPMYGPPRRAAVARPLRPYQWPDPQKRYPLQVISRSMLIITPTCKEKEPLIEFLHPDTIRVCGIGRVNTASFLTEEIITRRPNSVLLVGCAGAYHESGLLIGDIAVAQTEVNADEGVVDETGLQSMGEIGIPLLMKQGVVYFNIFPVNECLSNRLLECARAEDLIAEKGRFITVSAISGTKQRADIINKRIGALCENMEGAAAAHICMKYDIPFAEIRGISNLAGQRKPFDLLAAMTAVGRVLRSFLCDPQRL